MAGKSEATPSVEELRDQLDALWDRHLELLDTYHKAQQQLARHFSAGFFDLAQASFKSTSRVRYGQDYYDERMQASRRFAACLDEDQVPHLNLKVDAKPSPSSDRGQTGKVQDESTQLPTPPSTPSPELNQKQDTKQDSDEPESQDTKSADDKESATKKVRDPLHWYGILVPPALRSSQKSFISAVEGPVVEAANSAQALRHLTLEIRKLRKDIKKAEKRSVNITAST